MMALLLGAALWPFAGAAPAWGETIASATFVGPILRSATDGSIFAGGTGTATDPYRIATAEQLRAFRDAVNTGTGYEGIVIQLDADVDISGGEWAPIGASTRSGDGVTATSTPFQGTFNGDGHAITGLTISATSSADYALGLFGALDGAVVKNLKLASVAIDAATSELAGGAAGLMVNGSTVSNVQVAGTISAKAGVGGIAGRMTRTGTIVGCVNDAAVTAQGGTGNAGGMVGAAYYTTKSGQMTISDCVNNGAITGTDATGGIAGLCSAFVGRCTNNGTITGTSYGIGGITGDQKNYGAVDGCTNRGDVVNRYGTGYGNGGIVGWVRYDGAPPAYDASAVIAVTNNVNSATVKGGSSAGGIVGCMFNAGVVTGNQNTAPSIASAQFAGGIVGDLQQIDVATLPSGVTEGITVANNVSTTPADSITANFTGQFAYDNDPERFEVVDNGTAWVAQVGPERFATVRRAVAMAGAGGTASLIADATDQDTVEVSSGGTVTLDLNGHSIAFAQAPAFKLASGTLLVKGQGKVLTAGTAQDDLVAIQAQPGATAALQLQGGTYKQDVQPYVAPGFEQQVLAQAADGARYQVVAKQQEGTGGAVTPGQSGSGSGGNGSDSGSGNAAAGNGGNASASGTSKKPASDSNGAAAGSGASASGGGGTQAAKGGASDRTLPKTDDPAAVPFAAASLTAVASLATLLVALGLRPRRRPDGPGVQ